MTIIFIHGVATRNEDIDVGVERALRRHIAPVISADPERVPIEYAYWGDVAARFAWDGAARPRTPLLGQGADGELPVADLLATASIPGALAVVPAVAPDPVAPAAVGLVAAGPAVNLVPPAPTRRLKDLKRDELSDLLSTIASTLPHAPPDAMLILDEVASDPAFQARLSQCRDLDEERRALNEAVVRQLAAQPLAAQGAPQWLNELGDRMGEVLLRGVGLPGYVLSRATAELRAPLNDFVARFLGDVFTYLHERGTAQQPGPIPKRLLDKLERAHAHKQRSGEPIIVLSHSMGGQITYDAVSAFLPEHLERRAIVVDFWCATASQVALFEELKLFLRRDPAPITTPSRVPFPKNLGYWWNVWDHNDFISFTGQSIFSAIDDGPYDSGMSLAGAHGGYLERPSFYRQLADKVAHAKSQGWRHT